MQAAGTTSDRKTESEIGLPVLPRATEKYDSQGTERDRRSCLL